MDTLLYEIAIALEVDTVLSKDEVATALEMWSDTILNEHKNKQQLPGRTELAALHRGAWERPQDQLMCGTSCETRRVLRSAVPK